MGYFPQSTSKKMIKLVSDIQSWSIDYFQRSFHSNKDTGELVGVFHGFKKKNGEYYNPPFFQASAHFEDSKPTTWRFNYGGKRTFEQAEKLAILTREAAKCKIAEINHNLYNLAFEDKLNQLNRFTPPIPINKITITGNTVSMPKHVWKAYMKNVRAQMDLIKALS